jgi:hypothetical protein
MGRARTRARAEARTAARAQTNARGGTPRQKIAARRAAYRKSAARKRLLLAGGGVVAVLALVITLVVVKLSQSPAGQEGGASAQTTAQVQGQVTSIPVNTFNAVGAGKATGLKTLSGQPALTSDGKPQVLYMGGEYCPYCAAERWALAAAVSRFGTLTGVSLIHSSSTDDYANTATLSFVNASYTSRYLSFTPVEWYGQAIDTHTPFQHAYLQQPSAQQQALFNRYAGGALPFVDIGNHYLLPQVQYIPSVLARMSWAQISAAMRDPSTPAAKAIDGAANILTAAICAVTHGQPGGVCHAAGVTAAAKSL